MDITDKEKFIKKERLKLTRIFRDVDEMKKKTAEKLIDNAAFLSASLQELQDLINQKGYTEEYNNGGNQWGTRVSLEVTAYNKLITNYNGIIKMLMTLLPKDNAETSDRLAEFIMGKK